MEIPSDHSFITGILVDAKAKYGDLSNTTYQGFNGDKQKISYIIETLRTFLVQRKCIEDDLPKLELKTYFEDLSVLLIVNSIFSKPFNIEEYAHLTYNVPKISKYLLTEIVVGLNLTEYFCSIVARLPLVYSCELFCEFLPCLDKMKLQKRLQVSYFILNTIATIILNNQDLKYSDDMDTLLRSVPAFFFKFSSVSSTELPNLKKKQLYNQAGYALNKLFDLLIFCHKNNILYGIFMDQLIHATSIVLQGVPLDMFIYWAEIDLDSGQTLQSEISEHAYYIIEKYRDFKPASELLQLLKPFATKPKDIKDQIRMADMDRVVFMVNRADENQEHWFEALIFSPFISNQKAVKCVNKWSSLCKEEDVSRVLKLSLEVNDNSAKMLPIKCASHLTSEQLTVVTIRHFYNNGFKILKDDIQPEIVTLFNKLKDSESINETIMVELLLLILQNPEVVITFLLTECIQSTFYVLLMRNCFSTLKDILRIHDIGLRCLQKGMKTSPPSTQNSESYVKLFQLLLYIGLLGDEALMLKVGNPLIAEYLQNGNMVDLTQLMRNLNALNTSIEVSETTSPFFENLFKIIRLRTRFTNHSSVIQAAVKEVVILINNIRNQTSDVSILTEIAEDEDKYISYYKMRLCDSRGGSILSYLCNDFNIENHTRTICHLMQVLPSCVTEEWISICMEVMQKSDSKEMLSIMNGMMILLCEFTQNQKNSENFPVLIEALKYCIHQLGIVIQVIILSTNNFIESEVIVSEALVDLLCILPPIIKESEGLNLLSLMTERSLKNLGQNKRFVAKICRIKDTKICQILAQKIIG